MYKCKYFKIYELVPPGIYKLRGEKAWQLLDERALIMQDKLRERHGPATINDWFWGGNFKYSGYRPPSCKIGSKLSQHRFGRGFDPKFKNTDAETVRKDILENPQVYPYITSIELGIKWVHNDTRNYDDTNGILTFKPKKKKGNNGICQ